jgi:AAA domain
MDLIFIHGRPGVGKLTVAKELQKLTDYRLFHNHLTVDMLAAVFDLRSAAFAELRERFWLDVLVRAAQERISGVIFTCVFEPTILPGFHERLIKQVTAAGANVFPIELHCDLDENARRLVEPDRAVFLKMTDTHILRGGAVSGAYATPDIPGNFVLDTTKLSAAETARLILDHLEKS